MPIEYNKIMIFYNGVLLNEYSKCYKLYNMILVRDFSTIKIINIAYFKWNFGNKDSKLNSQKLQEI